MKLIMEGWRDFLKKPRDKKEPKEKEVKPPDSMVTALMNRGAVSQEEAEKMAKKKIELEEAAAILAEEEMSRRAALGALAAGAAGIAAGGTALASDAGLQGVVKSKARQFLQEAEQQLAQYLKANAADFANRIVPDIPFDADIIESLMKRTITTAIRANAEEIAECTMNFVTPDFVASLKNLDDEELQRYAEE